MTTNAAEPPPAGRPRSTLRASLEDQIRRRGIKPIESVDDMARDDVFESDEELDEFLAFVRAERQANLA